MKTRKIIVISKAKARDFERVINELLLEEYEIISLTVSPETKTSSKKYTGFLYKPVEEERKTI